MENEQNPEKTMEESKENSKKPTNNALNIGIRNKVISESFLSLNKERNETYEKTVAYLIGLADTETDQREIVSKLNQRIEELEQDNLGYRSEEDNYKHQIGDLQAKLDAAVKQANENAESGLGKQLQLDELRQRTEGAIIIKPNPVSMYFLQEMAQKENTTPDKILERLFIDDLQNPRANNLPYTVSASRIREVMEQLRKDPEK